ncbi:hypothetical protein AGR1B_Lc10053 [Agrobacterium fabacearum S56]|nr:hypothetical protein AGR1B_Lc10053 [Agrobacterium fabacearum S56]
MPTVRVWDWARPGKRPVAAGVCKARRWSQFDRLQTWYISFRRNLVRVACVWLVMLLACVRRRLFGDQEHISFVTSPAELLKIIPKQRQVVKLFGARRVW